MSLFFPFEKKAALLFDFKINSHRKNLNNKINKEKGTTFYRPC
jgi:hypothetical protein